MLGNLWYRSAIIYQVDIRTFYDGDGNGWGDFRGLIHQLDYISSLGATCIWLMPFNASPHRDGGYDLADHYSTDPRIGTLGDYVDFMEEAASRGLAVINDLVVNHTSTDHPWFVEASSSRDSEIRDYYIWRDEPAPPEESPTRIVFPEDDTSVWREHPESGQYYLHRFYAHEPDLNNAHPRVRAEVSKMIAFYLRLGASGFRVDAAPYVGEKASASPDYPDAHGYLKELRAFLAERRPDAVFMAEADVDAEELADFFGEGDEMNLLLNFLLAQYLFVALASEEATPIHDLLEMLPTPSPTGQYANFLRNHDELDMERLSDADRHKVYAAFAPEPHMQIYGRGIRRRLAPMLDGDPRRIRLAQSLLFSMPGTPVLYYGDEIGMGDDLSLDERMAVRLPMQWNPEANGGFSGAHRDRLYVAAREDGEFGYKRVNVADQRADPDSLLNWMRRLITTRKEATPVGHGEWSIVETGDDRVLGLAYRHADEVVTTFHNLSPSACQVTPKEGEDAAYLYEVFADEPYGHPEGGDHRFEIRPFGYRWLRGQHT